jgi:hypothetical protein
MTEDGNSLSRRKVIASAGAGVGTGLLAQLAPQPAPPRIRRRNMPRR